MPEHIPYHRAPGPLAAAVYRRQADRLEANRFYSSAPWIRLRAAYLAEHPLCEECGSRGIVEPAVDVHHVKERRDCPDLALDYQNLQALCKACHNRKRSG